MGKVISFPNKEEARGRQPLYVSHLNGKISASPHGDQQFEDRLTRIRSSLDRINKLMYELKRLNECQHKNEEK